MKPKNLFLAQPKYFWACVRTLSENIGYSKRGQGRILVPTIEEMAQSFRSLELNTHHIVGQDGSPTELANLLHGYFSHRADVLHHIVEPALMDAEEARMTFTDLRKRLNPSCPLPMNKQKGEKRAEAFLTCIVNMLIEENAEGFPCNYDPRRLTTFTRDGAPVRTLARRIDGAFPAVVNPIAVWELKEYYYTTTFGSRVADGVYESLLDGMELEELGQHEGINVKHYLIVDAYFTWWKCGKAYLCRLVDMLHMGFVDEVLFGKEVITEMPRIVGEWVSELKER